MASDIIFLKAEKLRILAERIHGIERKNLGDIQFRSTTEQVVYLRISNSNLQSVGSLLDQSGETVNRYKNDTVRGPIAALLFTYTETCLNNALQIFNNYTLRRDYLDKITSHLQNLTKQLDDLDTSNSADVASLTDQIVHYNEAVINYTKMSANSRASEEFSRRLRNSGIDFPTFVKRYQANLGFSGPFDKGKVLHKKVLKAIALPESFSGDEEKDISIMDVAGKAMLLKNAASITWDVYTSDHPIRTATRIAIVEIAEKGGALLEDIVTAAMVTLEVAEATSLFVTGVGFVAGFVGSYIVGQIAGSVFDAIFGSAGNDPLPNKDHIFYVAAMPDGKELARIVA
ncbi:hypothetical protein FEM48_Zijuj04G0191100 [Ziziphus jujuba var. spinosa]|uniref:Uncharacterized protein n=1 Tax=Ziziphus jujuba var. spinosa TaxID=714518 RepID=A0A978VLM9_ZIZJJ|nr:hypothetical protein FEM48_Zijuj04G0191100 [Ziziphus jujuba var. spinosa]